MKFISTLLISLALCLTTVAVPAQTGDANKYTTFEYSYIGDTKTCRYFDGFADNEDGTVTDPRDGSMWLRCPLGTRWDGQVCQGDSTKLNWFDAMEAAKNFEAAGHKDWRLPSKEEFTTATVGDISNSCLGSEHQAASTLLVPASNASEPKLRSLTSTTNIDTVTQGNHRANYSYAFDLKTTELYGVDFNEVYPVRLVRAGRGEAIEFFEKQYAKLAEYKAQVVTNEEINREIVLQRTQTWLYKLAKEYPNVLDRLSNLITLALAIGAPWILLRKQLLVHRWLPQKWWARLIQLLVLLLVCWLLGGISTYSIVFEDNGYADSLFSASMVGAITIPPYIGIIFFGRWLWRKLFARKNVSSDSSAQ